MELGAKAVREPLVESLPSRPDKLAVKPAAKQPRVKTKRAAYWPRLATPSMSWSIRHQGTEGTGHDETAPEDNLPTPRDFSFLRMDN